MIRVMISKPGLDGHDRGAKVIARALRDGGMEVIYTGIRQTPEQIVQAAIDEDVDILGISILSGAHMKLIPKILTLLKDKGSNIPIFVGGIIPDEDVNELKKMGVIQVYGPGTRTSEVIEEIKRYFEHANV
jgi:methylmalonyl-CoA mutase C-terminal domain/subunit|uniref:Cobalamin B12-binding domain-containing protein n=1 Tax=Mesoaciditoga lauensis TaxID=1495039 RepID=A0A7V3RFA3_9BACT